MSENEVIEQLRQEVERLDTENERHKAELEHARERHQEQLERMSNASRVAETQRRIEMNQREALVRLVKAHADKLENTVAEATSNDPFYRNTLKRAFTIARILGYRSEALRLAENMNEYDLYQESAEDSLEPENDREKFGAVAEIAHRQIWQESGRHPMEPQYRALWQKAFIEAKRMGLCNEFERVAGYLGIPTDYEVNWNGTVRVELTGVVYVPASGFGESEQPDPWEYAEEFDRDEIQWETESAEWSEWEVED